MKDKLEDEAFDLKEKQLLQELGKRKPEYFGGLSRNPKVPSNKDEDVYETTNRPKISQIQSLEPHQNKSKPQSPKIKDANLLLILEYIKFQLMEILPEIKQATLKAKKKYASDPSKLKSSIKKLQKMIEQVKLDVIKERQSDPNNFESIK